MQSWNSMFRKKSETYSIVKIKLKSNTTEISPILDIAQLLVCKVQMHPLYYPVLLVRKPAEPKTWLYQHQAENTQEGLKITHAMNDD